MSPQFTRLPGPIPEDLCSADGCERVVWARGLCDLHYQRLRATGATAIKSRTACSIDGCDRPAVRRGWCSLHYQRWHIHGDANYIPPEFVRAICKVEGCETPARNRGWCQTHYVRWKRTGTTDDRPLFQPAVCSVAGCEETAVARGWCSRHYQRWHEHGDPLFVVGLLDQHCPKPDVDEQTIGLVPLWSRGDMIRAWALVDIEDLDWATGYRWFLNTNGYARRGIDGSGRNGYILLHRELLGLTPTDDREGEHRNRNRRDNRRSNLLIVTRAQNAQNVSPRKGGSSIYRGVSWGERDQAWRAYVSINGKQISCGYHASEEQAAEAAREGRKKYLPFSID